VPSPLEGEGYSAVSTYSAGRGVPLSHSSSLKVRDALSHKGRGHKYKHRVLVANDGDYAAFSLTVSGTCSGLLAEPSIDSTVMKIMSSSPRFSRSCTLNSPAP